MIDTIQLSHVVPLVFADLEPAPSQVWRADVTFRRGELYMVEAASGTGKSSMCSFIYGMRSDYQGRILFDGADIRSFSSSRWCQVRRADIALLPQEMGLFSELSVIDNIEIKNRLTRFRSRQQIMDMLERLEIAHKAQVPCRLLSIGQQQRVAIVRTLCQPCSFMLLDEPVSHLDERTNSIAAALIVEEAASQGAALITTSVGNPLLIDAHVNSLAL